MIEILCTVIANICSFQSKPSKLLPQIVTWKLSELHFPYHSSIRKKLWTWRKPVIRLNYNVWSDFSMLWNLFINFLMDFKKNLRKKIYPLSIFSKQKLELFTSTWSIESSLLANQTIRLVLHTENLKIINCLSYYHYLCVLITNELMQWAELLFIGIWKLLNDVD